MRHILRLLRRIGGQTRRPDPNLVPPALEPRPGLPEALAMFDYGASDDPC